MVKQCRANLKKANLGKAVTCIEGDALKVLSTLEGEIDFLFLDAVREDCLKTVIREPRKTCQSDGSIAHCQALAFCVATRRPGRWLCSASLDHLDDGWTSVAFWSRKSAFTEWSTFTWVSLVGFPLDGVTTMSTSRCLPRPKWTSRAPPLL